MTLNHRHARDVYLGIDVGTQGVRVMAIDDEGDLVSECRASLSMQNREEQDPERWWDLIVPLLKNVTRDLREASSSLRPMSLSVSGTSGTIIPLDVSFRPLHHALLYSDQRCKAEVDRINRTAEASGVRMNTSWALPKMLWFQTNFPDRTQTIHVWRHVTDFVIGRLTNSWDTTDQTSALKTGYDPARDVWPKRLFEAIGVRHETLPTVVKPGTLIGRITKDVSQVTGLPSDLIVTTGLTDGCASQIAAGAVHPGTWNTTIGTTLVIKGTTLDPVHDPQYRIYNHRHPDGYWMPGGASNTGAAWISQQFPDDDLVSLSNEANRLTPTGLISWPLRQAGERFPFIAPNATGFTPPVAEILQFAAGLEGIAYLERLAYDLVERLSATRVNRVVSSGGGSRSTAWMQIRSNVLGRPVARARFAEAAIGAAIVSATATGFSSLCDAADALTSEDSIIEPDARKNAYESGYRQFVQALVDRGYIASAGTE